MKTVIAGGAVSQVDPDSSGLNPAWRKAAAHIVFGGNWPQGSTVSDIRLVQNTVKGYLSVLEDLVGPGGGAYFNEASLYEQTFEQTFFGDHCSKLQSIKNAGRFLVSILRHLQSSQSIRNISHVLIYQRLTQSFRSRVSSISVGIHLLMDNMKVGRSTPPECRSFGAGKKLVEEEEVAWTSVPSSNSFFWRSKRLLRKRTSVRDIIVRPTNPPTTPPAIAPAEDGFRLPGDSDDAGDNAVFDGNGLGEDVVDCEEEGVGESSGAVTARTSGVGLPVPPGFNAVNGPLKQFPTSELIKLHPSALVGLLLGPHNSIQPEAEATMVRGAVVTKTKN
ncbi:hypothetical protein D9757_000995 [Collybiopsis confluens]|uniref:Uncharacterized protein n=1 Tax=Collybiopsis confluens TaxID=2823264 RepID=A0A8H5MG17_9AGAR|nr:hypothetical protein D9757_000995 [Collybiopsis confluens]